ncbi:MAG: KamA family radical SAM protein [Planctomycetota bacterium]|nr:KamA family radical SAM protein [Planctomycetota bacterium]
MTDLITNLTISGDSVKRKPRRQAPGRLGHRDLLSGQWWRRCDAWRDVDEETFLDYRWQNRNSVTDTEQLLATLGRLVDESFVSDVEDGLHLAPMAIRLSPNVLSLIDWNDPYSDPIRRQFIPLGSESKPDHPMCALDSLAEQDDTVVPGLVHRYPDKVLFLALDVCPVYCRFCTRSYSIGEETDNVEKVSNRPQQERWEQAFEYLRENTHVEDVVVSGGDVYMLPAKRLRLIGEALLDIPHIRRVRFATKGLAVMPQKVLSDQAWLDALTDVVQKGRERGKHICVHTHFNHPREITDISRRACDELFRRSITVRNQSVLLRGVNDDLRTMLRLVRRLSWVNVQPYYVYIHDMVPGVETLRTTLGEAIELEKQVRGRTAGFMTPTFVCDAMGGGGKRDLHSFEHYEPETGIAIYRSPVVNSDRLFFYFDPLRNVAPPVRRAWHSEHGRERLLRQAVERADL